MKKRNVNASVITADVLVSGLNLISGPPDYYVASGAKASHIGIIIGALSAPWALTNVNLPAWS